MAAPLPGQRGPGSRPPSPPSPHPPPNPAPGSRPTSQSPRLKMVGLEDLFLQRVGRIPDSVCDAPNRVDVALLPVPLPFQKPQECLWLSDQHLPGVNTLNSGQMHLRSHPTVTQTGVPWQEPVPPSDMLDSTSLQLVTFSTLTSQAKHGWLREVSPSASAPPPLRAPRLRAAPPTSPSTEHNSNAFFDTEIEGHLGYRCSHRTSAWYGFLN